MSLQMYCPVACAVPHMGQGHVRWRPECNLAFFLNLFLFPPFEPDDPPTLKLNGVIDNFNVSAEGIQAPSPDLMNYQETFDSVDNSTVGRWGAVETEEDEYVCTWTWPRPLSERCDWSVLLCANCEMNKKRERGQTCSHSSKPQLPTFSECY